MQPLTVAVVRYEVGGVELEIGLCNNKVELGHGINKGYSTI
jgi:hypothetical protein